MNYRHVYHAGNFADVFKHIILIALLESLAKKDTAFCYIDTHAGTGYYDLFSESAKKTNEFENGIEKVIHSDNPPPLIKDYLNYVHQMNNELMHSGYASLRYYPGSPLIARSRLRPQDRMVICELHPEEYQTLHQNFAGDKQVAVHHLDGFLGLKAFLPPRERRGLVLIDPPFENPDEFAQIVHSLGHAIKRWSTGIYAIWYPVKDNTAINRFYRALKQNIECPILKIELSIYPDLPDHLNGSGVAIINPPWQLDQKMNEILPWLWNSLSINHQGSYSVSHP